MFRGMTWKQRLAIIWMFIAKALFLTQTGTPWKLAFSILQDDAASLDLDFKTLALFAVIIILVVIGASIYFTITTPAGQSGLAGIGQSIANAIASPFIALGNGIGKLFSSIFNGLGNAISHLL